MLAARDQENLAFAHQNGAAIKQQQGQAKRQPLPKTPGARFANTPLKVPLNDENAAGGAKSVLGGRTRGNENTLSKGKGLNKSTLVTPSETRSRAPLGNKTTNAKARGTQTVNVKSAVREIEKSRAKTPTTRPKQRHAQPELQKLQVHTEGKDPLSEEEVEYCPPKPKDLPYKSDVFPDGVLTFDGLKPENLFKGYYDYYYNPVDEHGVSLADRELEARNKKAREECDRRIKEDMDNFEWSIQGELESNKKTSTSASLDTNAKRPTIGRAPSTIRSRNAADALSMDETTKSMQRKAARSTEVKDIPSKKITSLPLPSFKRQPKTQAQTIPRKPSIEIEANSRTTIGYTKGRSTASMLAQGTTKPKRPASKTGFTRSDTTLSNGSDKTITPTLFAHKQASAAAEDEAWRERVPFLSIFNPEEEDDDEYDLLAGGMHKCPGVDDDEEFEFKLLD
ncbi:hypothetical protein F4677DRAFT_416190 [Hypoxylon crocopeplum]|nr:hypothetical protein F4677DRAFT_416190 [Hypoxylon crocopeplum]